MRTKTRTRQRRSGAALIIVVVVIAVAMTLAAGAASRIAASHRDLQVRERHAQAVRLAESGVRRAAARLRGDADYEGETWDLSADQLRQPYGAQVRIAVTPIDDQASGARVTATAVCDPEGARKARHTETLTFTTPNEESS